MNRPILRIVGDVCLEVYSSRMNFLIGTLQNHDNTQVMSSLDLYLHLHTLPQTLLDPLNNRLQVLRRQAPILSLQLVFLCQGPECFCS
jgi:hypothetical protein